MNMLRKFFGGCGKWIARPRNKKLMYVLAAGLVVLLGLYRFAMVGAQNRMSVYNPARAVAEFGVPVRVIEMHRTDGVLYEPISVKNNRAMVSGGRVAHFRPGQKVGDGSIVSVSQNIDYNTGMYIVRTRGVADGLNYAEYNDAGYFVPAYAVPDGVVMVAQNGVAVARNVKIGRTDADTVLVTDGLSDGDIVILSHIDAGANIQINK